MARDKGDGHLCDFFKSVHLGEQVEGTKAIGDLITKIRRAGDGLGLHMKATPGVHNCAPRGWTSPSVAM